MLWKTFMLLPKGNWLSFLKLEQCVFCITTTYLRSLAFKAGERNRFSYAPNQDRCRLDEAILRVHEATLTTKSETATC